MIYADNVAGTKPDRRVVDKMIPYLTEKYGNPSAHFYQLGRESFEAMDEARDSVASFIGAEKDEVIFTSCGTESNNLAIKGVLDHGENKGKKHIIISEIEHFSIQNVCVGLMNEGYEITKIRVDENGKLDLKALDNAIRSDTALVSIIHASPEIGTIQDIKKIGEMCKNKNVLFHTDAVASAGHMKLDVKEIQCDLLSLAGQNFYGPKGSAALYVGEGVKLNPIFQGGFQEKGLRSGSENIPAIVGLGEASRIAADEMHNYSAKMKSLQDKLWKGLDDMFDFIHFTGDKNDRMPGHVSFWIEYIEGESLLLWYSLKGICGASGSACSSNIQAEDEDDLEASHVLTAVGVPNDICAGSLTFSLSKYSTDEDVEKILDVTPEIVNKLCEMSPYYNK